MIDDLFSPTRIQPLAPEPGAADAAWSEVSRRRRKRTLRTQVAIGAALVVVVMVGLLPSLDEDGRVAELDVAGQNSSQHAPADTPSLLEGEMEDASDRGPEDDSGRVVTSDRPGRSPSAVSAPPVQTRPGVQAPAPGRTKPTMDRSRDENIYIGCFDWCLSAQVLQEQDHYALSLDLCVAVGGRARRFSFATTQEVDLWVDSTDSAPGETRWKWSLGQQFAPDEHHVDIRPSECVTWKTRWDGTDERGEPLPAGNYRLFAKSLAEQTAPNSTTETTFQISE